MAISVVETYLTDYSNLASAPCLQMTAQSSVTVYNQMTNIALEAGRYYFPDGDPTLERIRRILNPQLLEFLFIEDSNSSKLDKKKITLIGEGGKVLSHADLSGWLFKGIDEAGKVIENKYGKARPNKYNHVHRVFMADRMRQYVSTVCQSQDINEKGIKILIPNKRLVPVSQDDTVPFDMKFVVVCEKMDVFDAYHSKRLLKECNGAQQRAIAKMICDFIIKTGFIDANAENIVLHKRFVNTPGNETVSMTVLDTEPQGALADISDREPNTRLSLKTCGLMGLEEFKQSFADIPVFVEEADSAIASL